MEAPSLRPSLAHPLWDKPLEDHNLFLTLLDQALRGIPPFPLLHPPPTIPAVLMTSVKTSAQVPVSLQTLATPTPNKVPASALTRSNQSTKPRTARRTGSSPAAIISDLLIRFHVSTKRQTLLPICADRTMNVPTSALNLQDQLTMLATLLPIRSDPTAKDPNSSPARSGQPTKDATLRPIRTGPT